MNDLKFAFRQLLKNPGFTVVAVLTLALGIGANTAIFTVINTVLLRSLPVKNPNELVQVVVTSESPRPNYTFSYPFYERLRDGGRSLSGLFAAGGVGRENRLIVPNGAEVEFVRAQPVSGNFFSVLGVPAMLGRTISDADDRPGNPQAVVVISHSFWQRRFEGDSSVVGKKITFDDLPFTIVGVTLPGFFGFQPGENPDMWWPLQMAPRVGRILDEGNGWLRLMGRFSPGIDPTFAVRTTADPRMTMAGLASVVRGVDRSVRVRDLRTMNDVVNGSVHQERLIAQLGGFFSVFALALACLGLYGVLSFAVVQRTREIGVRVALGAKRRNVLSLVVGKGLRLALIGSVLGLAGALAATRLVSNLLYGVTPTDPVTFAGVVLLLVVVAMLASWLPARRATKIDPMEALRYE